MTAQACLQMAKCVESLEAADLAKIMGEKQRAACMIIAIHVSILVEAIYSFAK